MDYKGYEIEIGHNDMINCNKLNLSADTVPAIKKAIDAHIAKQNKAARVPVLLIGYRESVPTEAVAGAADLYGHRLQFWIKESNGERSKRNANTLYLDTPEARAAFEKRRVLYDKARELAKEADAAIAKLPTMADKFAEKDDDE